MTSCRISPRVPWNCWMAVSVKIRGGFTRLSRAVASTPGTCRSLAFTEARRWGSGAKDLLSRPSRAEPGL